jgi:hypothetical protein
LEALVEVSRKAFDLPDAASLKFSSNNSDLSISFFGNSHNGSIVEVSLAESSSSGPKRVVKLDSGVLLLPISSFSFFHALLSN